MPRPQFDEEDKKRADLYWAVYAQIQGPRVGDYLELPDGTYLRFAHVFGNAIQTTVNKGHPWLYRDASFFLGYGYVSFSGSLAPSIAKERIAPCCELTKDGSFWFFHHANVEAHNGVSFTMPCRVFKLS